MDRLKLIDLIDDLGEATDRCEALSLMAEGIRDTDQSSAWGRVIGDVQRLVSKTVRTLNEEHERRGGA